MNHKEKYAQAQGIYIAGLERARTTPPPNGQKYPPGTRVSIRDGLRLNSGTVLYTYAHAYGGDDVKNYCLDVNGRGPASWYLESQLTQVADNSKTTNKKVKHEDE